MSAPLYGERPVDEPTADPAEADGAPHGGSGLVAERARRQGLVDEIRARPAPSRTRTASTAPTRWPRCAPTWPDLAPGSETDAEVAVAGRVVLKRDAGKLVFATIAERGAELQLFISKAAVGDEAFAASRRSTAATGSAPTAG